MLENSYDEIFKLKKWRKKMKPIKQVTLMLLFFLTMACGEESHIDLNNEDEVTRNHAMSFSFSAEFSSNNRDAVDYFPGSKGDFWEYTHINKETSKVLKVSNYPNGRWQKYSDFAGMGEMWLYLSKSNGYVYAWKKGIQPVLFLNLNADTRSYFKVPASVCSNGYSQIRGKTRKVSSLFGSHSFVFEFLCGNRHIIVAKDFGVIEYHKFDSVSEYFLMSYRPQFSLFAFI